MAKPSTRQKKVVERVMHAFKEGDLEQRDGGPVRDRKQAIAIALSEAGSSDQKSPAENKATLRRTERRQRAAGESRAELYAQAQRRDIKGRSSMTKAQLEKALRG